MRAVVDKIDLALGRGDRVRSFDLTPSGRAVAAIDDGSRSTIRFPDGSEVTVPHNPGLMIVTACGEDAAVVVLPRTTRTNPNAWVATPAGRGRPFFVGDAVEDVLFLRNGSLVATYFDEGFGEPVSEEAIAAFDLDGNLQRGYGSSTGRSIMDCYAAVAVGSSRVAVWPYPDWRLVVWDTDTGTERTHLVPGTVRGATAITHAGDRWWFFSPYDHPHAVFEWKIDAPKVTEVGVLRGPLRGLPGGRFLDLGEDGPAVVSLT